ncbi:hypothetical protein SAMN05428642_101704 [Flaviramulus basaltis]|uniref:Outer membrane protein beta-barrel domain-containing protein n=1 Tax=Flaviramulus basaltis TaxID=369401 RepID=A0A1K2IE94_9FLAO|nr:hypothetical protein [Flaviramulus basaltis]SFZ90035.1 hypothetical protein SAMN05428642_101704 [Flaviramulus basaltis]
MSDKKHIDRLFQEGLKDFEATPRDAVWENIEAKLNKKKKKRLVIPIWWRYAGIAALLLLLLTIGSVYFKTPDNSNDNQKNQVVETENNASEKTNTQSKTPLEDLNSASETKTAVTDNSNSKEDIKTSTKDANFKSPLNNLTPSNESSVAENSATKNKNESKAKQISNKTQNAKNTLLDSSNNKAVANHYNENTSKENLQNKKENSSTTASSNEENAYSDKKDELLINKDKAQELINHSKNNTAITDVKDEETETLADNKTEEKTLTIEDALEKNKDIIEEEEETQNRWSIAPNAAPVYFNSLGDGSSIDPQFNKNSKSGELNMSYGIAASYAINNKLTIRSGINKVNLGYNTNDVIVFQSTGIRSSSGSLQNVNASTANINSDISQDVVSITNSFESLNTAKIPESFETTNTSINQAFGYIEIPLEIQYTLSDKKLGVNVIGGFSSFFLNNNEIFSEAENGSRTFLGEANNINKVSYSANFGLGLNYKMSKKIDLNLEPIFKYQINTFKNTSGNFTPFFIGVYTGFAIKF